MVGQEVIGVGGEGTEAEECGDGEGLLSDTSRVEIYSSEGIETGKGSMWMRYSFETGAIVGGRVKY